MTSRPYHDRESVFNNIIFELEKITGDEKIDKIKKKLNLVSNDFELTKQVMAGTHPLVDIAPAMNKHPKDICKEKEDEKIPFQSACEEMNDLDKAIREERGLVDRNIIQGYRHNWHKINKYLAIVYLLKEDLIDLDTFNHLRKMFVDDKIGGFNKRRRETRKNKSKRKKLKNKSKRKKPKNKSKRKKPKNKSTRKTKH